ncbi:regulatory protein, luxR family [Noviherbaspirillum humi]|uniref:Regulatory protein, luxR family n=1 Tax=Noviherbaspirillum humi TaxID=1688639 RepID=A0A239LYH0_9BURK|nr:helix-turn-helix transcriptional regulator [Noviherbaspirillum humi]SNT35707.1 regulatory protein, luxR family [Noviherbaspirillum humi]
MKALSRSLVDLYESAECLSTRDFPSEVLQIVRRQVPCDGAMLGEGEVAPASADHLLAQVPPLAPEACPPWRGDNLACWHEPSIICLMQGLSQALQFPSHLVCRNRPLAALAAFGRRHRLHHLLLQGDPPLSRMIPIWLLLYRAADEPFRPADEERISALWPHVYRALAINRAASRAGSGHGGVARAVIGAEGAVCMADPGFHRWLALEFDHRSSRRLPAPLLQCWRAGTCYTGRHIKVAFATQDGYAVCEAAPIGHGGELTRAERRIADDFAMGMKHSEIARRRGISHNTVRTHLAHVYAKLGVHTKIDLARSLAHADARGSLPALHGRPLV